MKVHVFPIAASVAALVLALFLTAASPSGQAAERPEVSPQETLTLYADADATVKSWQPNTNFGGEHVLELSYSTGDMMTEEVVLVHFDLAALPAGAIIDSAIMELYLVSAAGDTPKSIAAYYITGDWAENTVTWSTFPTANPTGIIAAVDDVTGRYKSWTVTEWAAYWHNRPSENHGVYLRRLASETSYFERVFESRDHNERMPRLVITYHLPPTATPTATLPPNCQDLMVNGDFESGSLPPWGNSGSADLGPGRSSAYGAWLGAADNAVGELLQVVTIPAAANPARLEFWWQAESEIAQPGDALEVLVQYEGQADNLRTLPALAPLGEWRQEAVDLTAYAGRTVAVTFLAHTDGEIPTTFRLDDVALWACGIETPTATPTNTSTNTPTNTPRLPTPTNTPVPPTPTPTNTPTNTPRPPTPTNTPVPPTPTPTNTSTNMPVSTNTSTNTPVPPTPTNTPVPPTSTNTPTAIPTLTPTVTGTPIISPTPSRTATVTPTPTQIIWIHFDEFPDGTFVENQYSNLGVHFLSDYLASKPYRAAPKIHAYNQAHTTPNVLLNEYSNAEFSNSANVPLVFWFDQPVWGVGMWLGTDGAGRVSCNGAYQATVRAYDCAGNQVASTTVSVSQAFNTSFELDDSQGRIQRVVIDYGNTECPEAIDELAFAPSGAICSDSTPPQISITSPPDGAVLPSIYQSFKGKINEPGILTWSRLNGSKLPVYMSNPNGEYTFNFPVVLAQGTNSMVVTASNISGKQGQATAVYQVGTPTQATLTDLHISQRGVVKNKTCDIDTPLVAGKSTLVRIGLDVKTPAGIPTYASTVAMSIYRQSAGGDILVDTVWGTAYPDSYGVFVSTNQMKEIHFWVDGNTLQTPGNYRFTFQPYVSTTPIGQPLQMSCDGYYHTFSQTKPLRVLLVPVELGINSPLLQSINYASDVFAQLQALARTFPVSDLYGSQPGLHYYETAPFRMCDGTATTKTLSPKVCLDTGWEWEHIYKGLGTLLRADDETVFDNSQNFCDANDHKVGGRIKSNATFTYNFDASLGIFRPGAHPNWQGEKHMTPTDEDHDGDIDMQDMQKFIASFRDSNGQWSTDLSKYDTGEVFRFFSDTNGNQCNDVSTDTQAPIRKKAHDQILWGPQNEALNSLNAQIPGTANDYTNALLIFPNSFIAADCKFGCIGPGQGQSPGSLVWTRITGPASTFAHEVGHNIGALPDLYLSSDPQADDMATKEGATAVYIDRQKVPANQVFAVMTFEVAANRTVHYQPHYQTLYNKLKMTTAAEAAETIQDARRFVVSGRILADGSATDLDTQLATGLEATPTDSSSPYKLVFGSGATVLLEHPFAVGINAPPPEGFNDWPKAEQIFWVIAPYPDGTNWVELRRGTAVLARFEPSAHAPTVHVVTPNGGEVFAGDAVTRVSWAGSDQDGDDLLYSVYYSPDAGNTWNVIAPSIAATSLEWSLANMPGTSAGGLVRVVARDGFHQAEDVSDATFTVANKPPLAAIISPAAGQTILQCGRVHLQGAAFDPEGSLGALAWHVDGEVVGDQVAVDLAGLPVGPHILAFRAEDQQGAAAEAEVQFIILADSDCDGMSDDFETQYGLDPEAMADASEDRDGDGLSNLDEYWYGIDPTDPDSDGDGYPDGQEVALGSDPADPHSVPSRRALYLPLVLRLR